MFFLDAFGTLYGPYRILTVLEPAICGVLVVSIVRAGRGVATLTMP
jgi:hypothetical protein